MRRQARKLVEEDKARTWQDLEMGREEVREGFDLFLKVHC
jgi:hypothetical protein